MCRDQTIDLEVPIPAHLSHTGQDIWRVKPIDACIAPVVADLIASGFFPIASCCGHYERPPEIIVMGRLPDELRRARQNGQIAPRMAQVLRTKARVCSR